MPELPSRQRCARIVRRSRAASFGEVQCSWRRILEFMQGERPAVHTCQNPFARFRPPAMTGCRIGQPSAWVHPPMGRAMAGSQTGSSLKFNIVFQRRSLRSPTPPCRVTGHTEEMELPRESPYARSVDRFMAQMRGGRRSTPSSAGGRARADGQEDFGSAGKRTAQSPAPAMHDKRSEGLPSEGKSTRHGDNAEEAWLDIRKGREDLPQRQIICECCGFWVYVVSRSQCPLLCRCARC